MKALFCLFLAGTLSLNAADKTANGTIAGVTVFGDRAEVTREATLDLEAGTHHIRFEGLPANTDRQSLQLQCDGPLVLQDIRLVTTYLEEVANEQSRALFKQLNALKLDRRRNELATARIEQEIKALQSIWKGVTTPTDGAAVATDPEQWAGLLEMQSKRSAALDQQGLELEVQRKELDANIRELEQQIQKVRATQQRSRTDVVAVVEARQSGPADLQLTYQTPGASWSPTYQVRADSQGGNVEIVYRANVRQSTGEDWTDVALSLSTAQPHIDGREPELRPWWIAEVKPMPVSAPAPQESRARGYALAADEADYYIEGKKAISGEVDFLGTKDFTKFGGMEVSKAVIQQGLIATKFDVPAKVTVATSAERVVCTILQFNSAADYRHTAVPKLSPYTYLKAEIANATNAQLLPGQGSIFIDGNFVGKADLDLVAPGEKFWVYLGVDPAVTVERNKLQGKDSTEGIFNKTKRMVTSYEFVIKNQRQQPIQLSLWDQLPMASNEDIEVELLVPEVGKRGAIATIDDQKRLEWKFSLKPGQDLKTPLSYTIQYPQDMLVSGL
ncbi:mucoidy inhibitor MuiA family protein [Cerasicoccus maritimus]|uniref:mucoidy inhibitor MuiA family protein n=1 Tax=Cerasicoccus maritimus TaxID=490089 RepID=UPI002852888A|nr:mucoidy inhibitor MuiA family protein [Cerasicoccus maritimus]